MKPIAILSALLFGAVLIAVPTDGELLNKLVKVCTKDQNVSAELLERYEAGDFPDDRYSKCVMRCIALNLGVYDDLNGIHMYDTWLMFKGARPASEEQKFNEEHHECIQQHLANVPRDDYCEVVYQIYQCYKDEFRDLLEKLKKAKGKGRD